MRSSYKMLPASGPKCLQVAGSRLRLAGERGGVEPFSWSQEGSRGSAFWAQEYGGAGSGDSWDTKAQKSSSRPSVR